MRIVLPLALMSIFVILYIQFKRTSTTLIVFSGIFVAWAGGFTLIWLYGQPWFMNFSLGSLNFREIFQIHEINLSVAVWVGFLALFGIATDDGVLISTYLDQQFKELKPTTRKEIQAAAILAGKRRIRPAMLTTATTLLALIPVLTSTGRGADVMVPMAIPSFGGMLFAISNTFVVPVLYVILAERRLLTENKK
jgi:Cu(I)/Ag(I) efflux system membrane protein CusA/SilA